MPVLDAELEQRAAYAKAFRRAALAFVLTMVDIRIGSARTFDLVPDLVGYLLFIDVARALLPLHSAAVTVRTHAAILAALAVLMLLVELLTVNGGALFLPLGLLALVVDMIMVWILCGIVMDVAQHLSRPKLARAADIRRRVYIGYIIFLATAPLFAITFAGSDLSGVVAVVLFAAFLGTVVLVIQMYGLMRITERVVTVD